jgi:hypothetical protein
MTSTTEVLIKERDELLIALKEMEATVAAYNRVIDLQQHRSANAKTIVVEKASKTKKNKNPRPRGGWFPAIFEAIENGANLSTEIWTAVAEKHNLTSKAKGSFQTSLYYYRKKGLFLCRSGKYSISKMKALT